MELFCKQLIINAYCLFGKKGFAQPYSYNERNRTVNQYDVT